MAAQGLHFTGYTAVNDRTAGYIPVFGEKKPPDAAAPAFADMTAEAAKSAAIAPAGADTAATGFFSFIKSVIDVVNPLHHIPVISTIYRHFTGDEIAPAARLAGSALYGGPLGMAMGAADVVLEKATGRDMGATAMAFVTGKGADAPATQTAEVKIKPDSNSVSTPSTASAPTQASRTRTVLEGEPALHSTPASVPVLVAEGAKTRHRNDGREVFPPSVREDFAGALRTQEAPAEGTTAPVPPELIAVKMMEALDQYGAMKKHSGYRPGGGVSGSY